MPPLSTASVKSEEFKSITTSEPPSEAEITSNNQIFLNHHDNGKTPNNFDHDESTVTATNLNTSGNNLSLFDTENPWDLVPDQPANQTTTTVAAAFPPSKKEVNTNISLSTSSNGLKMSTSPLVMMSNSLKDELDLEIMEEITSTSSEIDQIKLEIEENDEKITTSTTTGTGSCTTTQSLPIGNNIMDDPFDAEWVSLALKQSNNQEIL